MKTLSLILKAAAQATAIPASAAGDAVAHGIPPVTHPYLSGK